MMIGMIYSKKVVMVERVVEREEEVVDNLLNET